MPTKAKRKKPQTETKARANKSHGAANVSPEDMEMSKDLTQYVTTKQAAEMLGVDPDHINHLLAKNKIRGIKPGGWSWLVYVPSIERYNKLRSPKGRPRSRRVATKTS